MTARRALAALTTGLAISAHAQPPAVETVTITGTRELPMVARCEQKAVLTLPANNDSALGKLGLQVCFNEGTLESLLPKADDRLKYLSQLLLAYNDLRGIRLTAKPHQDGDTLPSLPNFSATSQPDGNFRFIWEIKNGSEPATVVTGIISPRAAPN